jgi:glucosamine--fructose-6-phosphate aminotransferase (isomerizing)
MDMILRDILEQPRVITNTISEGERTLSGIVERLESKALSRVYFVGAGTSNFVGLLGRYAFERWSHIPCFALSAMDYTTYGITATDSRSLIIAISQSGESYETIAAAEASIFKGLRTIALTNNKCSRLGKMCSDVILTKAGEEAGPGTKTVTAQNIAIYQLSLHIARKYGPSNGAVFRELFSELGSASNIAARMLSNENMSKVIRIAEQLISAREIYLIGAGPFFALALQVANFLREVSKINCYPFEACEFRHGPLEVLSRGSLILAMSSSTCQSTQQMLNACSAAAKAGADLIYVGDESELLNIAFRNILLLDTASELLAAQLYLIPMHILGYNLAKKKGIDPNVFNNIVKTWAK